MWVECRELKSAMITPIFKEFVIESRVGDIKTQFGKSTFIKSTIHFTYYQ